VQGGKAMRFGEEKKKNDVHTIKASERGNSIGARDVEKEKEH